MRLRCMLSLNLGHLEVFSLITRQHHVVKSIKKEKGKKYQTKFPQSTICMLFKHVEE